MHRFTVHGISVGCWCMSSTSLLALHACRQPQCARLNIPPAHRLHLLRTHPTPCCDPPICTPRAVVAHRLAIVGGTALYPMGKKKEKEGRSVSKVTQVNGEHTEGPLDLFSRGQEPEVDKGSDTDAGDRRVMPLGLAVRVDEVCPACWCSDKYHERLCGLYSTCPPCQWGRRSRQCQARG